MLLLALAAVLVLSACSKDSSDDGVKASKDTLTIACNADHGNVNKADSIGDNAAMLASLATNSLFDQYYKEDGSIGFGVCDRSLAESYQFDDDYLGISINLRKGVKFQNGVEMKASDVVFSLGFFSSKSNMKFIDFENAAAVDDYTVHIPLNYVYRSVLKALGIIGIWSEQYWDEVGGDAAVFFHDAPIGTGAFQIVKYITDDYAELNRFDDYFEGPAKLARIRVRFIGEASVAFAELETGGVDYIFTPGGTDVKNVQNGDYGDDFQVYSALQENAFLIGFNGYSKALKDIKVRQAVAHAINRSSVTTVFSGVAADIYTILSNAPGTMTDYSKNWFYPYDPAAAKAKLKEAGYEDRDNDGLVEDASGNKITLRYLYIGPNQMYAAAGEVMKSNLADVGITLELLGYDVPTYDAMMRNDVQAWDFFEMNMASIAGSQGWNYTPETLMITYNHIDQYENYGEYYSKYIEPMNTTLDDDKWWEIFRDFEDAALTKFLYWYPLCQRLDFSIYASNLKNFERVNTQTWNLKDTYFE